MSTNAVIGDASRTKRRAGRARAGLTLIEGIVTMVVMSIAIPPLVMAIASAASRRASQTLATRARWLASERLESVMADRHSTTRGYAFLTPANYPAEASISGFPGFSRTTSIVTTGPNFVADTGYRTVSVSVSYQDPIGGARTLILATVLTDYTP
jgi:Tfp pilus assembly protein PilV